MNRLPFSPVFVFLPLLSGVGGWWVSSHRGA